MNKKINIIKIKIFIKNKMKKIKINIKKIKFSKQVYKKDFLISSIMNFIIQKAHSILISINFVLTIYLLIQNNRAKMLNKELLSAKANYKKKDFIFDEDMVGLKYPEIEFKKIQTNILKGEIINSVLDFFKQLQIKLIYLEKEINATKLNSFFTRRILYLKKRGVEYNDAKITEYHDIINWLVIHKSTQLKGIASDKYLACKYVIMKIGKNLCPHRIGVYNNVEEIDLEKIIKMGNVVLKVSNGFDDNIFITEKNNKIEEIKKDLIFKFNRNYPLRRPSFFHFYSKKRIVLEKMFTPITDLFEFRILLINHSIKMIILNYIKHNKMVDVYYDEFFNSIKDVGNKIYDMSKFNNNTLEEMKSYAVKLSEDFPNFVRVDLYIFHDKVYLSEITFDSHSGIPTFRDIKHFVKGIKTWKRIDN